MKDVKEYDVYVEPKDGSPGDWYIVEAENAWDALRHAMWEEEMCET